jgi:hypothetical protein
VGRERADGGDHDHDREGGGDRRSADTLGTPGRLVAPDYFAIAAYDGRVGVDASVQLQAALNAQCSGIPGPTLYIPAGVYKLDTPLRFSDDCPIIGSVPMGGWILGDGREKTILVRNFDDALDPLDPCNHDPVTEPSASVLESGGMNRVTFQGLTFRTSPYFEDGNGRGMSVAAVDLDHTARYSIDNFFVDVGFEGRLSGVGLGSRDCGSGSKVSEHMIVDSRISDGKIGLSVSGGGNALSDVVVGSVSVDNEIAMGDLNGHGTFAAYRSSMFSTDTDIKITTGAGYHFEEITSTSQRSIHVAVGTSGIVVDQSHFDPAAGADDTMFRQRASGARLAGVGCRSRAARATVLSVRGTTDLRHAVRRGDHSQCFIPFELLCCVDGRGNRQRTHSRGAS